MPSLSNYSYHVKSHIIDIELLVNELRQLGHFTEEDCEFLDKFLYKNELARQAVTIYRQLSAADGHHGAQSAARNKDDDLSVTKSTSNFQPLGVAPVITIHPSESQDVERNAMDEEYALQKYLTSCTAEITASKLNGSDEITNNIKCKVQVTEPVPKLTSMAEWNVDDVNRGEPKPASDYNPWDIAEGAAESALDVDRCSTVEGSMKTVTIEDSAPTNIESEANLKQVSLVTESTVTAISSELKLYSAVDPVELQYSTDNETVKSIRTAKISFVGASKQISAIPEAKPIAVAPPVTGKSIQKPKLNAWGKPVKNPTWNDEGDIVGGLAEPIGTGNKGHAMLMKMGWTTGRGLGKDKMGVLEPVPHVVKNLKHGLGASTEKVISVVPESSCSDSTPLSPSSSTGKKSDWDCCTSDDPEYWARETKPRGPVPKAKGKKAINLPERHGYAGIQAKFECEGPYCNKRTLEVPCTILSTNETKMIKHRQNFQIVAKSFQAGERLGKKNWMLVHPGDRLELMSCRGGNTFDVYSFAKLARGVVRIDNVEMENEPDYSQDGKPPPHCDKWDFELEAEAAASRE